MVQLNWKASDRAATSTGSPQSHHGLTTGAKIAIGVVVPLVLFGIAIVVAILVFLRRKRKFKNVPLPPHHDKPELDASIPVTNARMGNLLGVERSEMEATDELTETSRGLPHELPVPTVFHELADPSQGTVDSRSERRELLH